MPFVDNIGFLMSRASGQLVRATNAALGSEGLRVRQYSVLSVVCESGGSSQRELAAVLGLDPSQVVALVDDLDAAGLVERRPSPADRRTKVVVPTEAGIAAGERAAGRAAKALEETLAPLTDEERATLRTLLARVTFATR
ncbi:MarR family winged helix-turn-helix transcriptional regulator [Cryptosporangium phraense]|uniref:Winged helix-turn-helix transcriptional regulator n=1 Tax=Cryptosporangium phraense TaxID=2593070 RepID=A0A545ALA4_9ACTN|nr:MarR family winged helix-turn-helix transcriptional regulator [Cryptosporangium phraense]TQS42097.1 winged helix-turn-helix transcriptional regulator [Cryptosporangium phraense]